MMKYIIDKALYIIDPSTKEKIWGKITKVTETTVTIQWEDLISDNEYEQSKIHLRGSRFIELSQL